MRYLIRACIVRTRSPYYLRCSYCNNEIEGSKPEDVANQANRYGWLYDYEHDAVICNECLKEEVEDGTDSH